MAKRMVDEYRGFPRTALLDRARSVLEDEGLGYEAVDLLDEMETWSAQSLYQWLYEHDARFESTVRSRLMTSR